MAQVNFDSIIQAFQDLRYIGESRQRWKKIKRLHQANLFVVAVLCFNAFTR